MINIGYFILLIMTGLLAQSCMDIFEYDKSLIEPYHLRDAPETANKKTIYYTFENGGGIGRIEYVKEIGWNEDFIIAIDENRKYFILEIEKDNRSLNANDIVIGPMIISEFEAKRKVLQIDFDFKLEIE